MRTVDLPAPNPFSYDLTRWIVRTVSKQYFRVEVTHVGRVPSSGGFILAPVHRSNLDPPLCSLVTHRRLCFLAKRSLFKSKIFGAYLRSLGAIPITRGAADLAAFKSCLGILKAGHGLVVFPEGTRKSGSAIGELEEGAVALAQRAKVPVVPVAIHGSDIAFGPGSKFPKRERIRIVVGEPINDNLTPQLLRQHLQELFTTYA